MQGTVEGDRFVSVLSSNDQFYKLDLVFVSAIRSFISFKIVLLVKLFNSSIIKEYFYTLLFQLIYFLI